MKTCVKREPGEKVGVVCKKNGKYDIIEYSELTDEQANRVKPGSKKKNDLFFELGNILIFMLSSSKLLDLCGDTATLNKLYHIAHKKVEAYDEIQKIAIKPDSNNAYKFELFLHNFLPFVTPGKFGALTVTREDEFAPVKNANVEGKIEKDSPDEAR